MYRAGQHDVAGIARLLGVSRASVYRALTDAQPIRPATAGR